MSDVICPRCNTGKLSYSGLHDSGTGTRYYICEEECGFDDWFNHEELDKVRSLNRSTIYHIVKNWKDESPVTIKADRNIWTGDIVQLNETTIFRVIDIEVTTKKIRVSFELGIVKAEKV